MKCRESRRGRKKIDDRRTEIEDKTLHLKDIRDEKKKEFTDNCYFFSKDLNSKGINNFLNIKLDYGFYIFIGSWGFTFGC